MKMKTKMKRILALVATILCFFRPILAVASDSNEDDEFSLRKAALASWNGQPISYFVQDSEDGWRKASLWHNPDTNWFVSEYVVDSDSKYYSVVDGVLYSKDMSQLLLFPPMKEIWYFQVPSCVHEISDVAFMGSYYLRDLVITDSVTSFGEELGCDLFYESRVETIYFPNSSTLNIHIDGFAYMPCVQKIVVPRDSLLAERFIEVDQSGYLCLVSSGVVRFY